MQFVYREMTRDGAKSYLHGKMEFDWWKTIQAREKLPNVYLVQ